MKLVQAYIKPHKLSEVTLALHEIEGLTGMSVVEIRGFGRGKGKDSSLRTVKYLVDFVAHIKIEIYCGDVLVDQIVSTIQTAAHTGLRGDGKIYISSADGAVRISTGEQGEEAV